MNIQALEHVLRAYGSITDCSDIVVIGSQAIRWCLSPVDIAASKLAAGREKDLLFVSQMLSHELVTASSVAEVLGDMDAERSALARARLTRITGN